MISYPFKRQPNKMVTHSNKREKIIQSFKLEALTPVNTIFGLEYLF